MDQEMIPWVMEHVFDAEDKFSVELVNYFDLSARCDTEYHFDENRVVQCNVVMPYRSVPPLCTRCDAMNASRPELLELKRMLEEAVQTSVMDDLVQREDFEELVVRLLPTNVLEGTHLLLC